MSGTVAEGMRKLLGEGTLTVRGRIPGASNAVLYGTVSDGSTTVPCVHKPVMGERPLWDFPDGTLAAREVATYEVCQAMGWDLVPVTVLRDGPWGEGMCQQWVGSLTPRQPDGPAADEDGGAERSSEDAEVAEEHAGEHAGEELFALVDGEEPGPGWKPVGFADVGEGRPALLVHADDERLRRLAVLDAVLNNADRKGGHLLFTSDGQLRAIDHGVTFHTDDKLRTLLWGWAGEPLTAAAQEALRALSTALGEGNALATRLAGLLTEVELEALRKRTDALLSSGRHPLPGGDWPAIPWPPL